MNKNVGFRIRSTRPTQLAEVSLTGIYVDICFRSANSPQPATGRFIMSGSKHKAETKQFKTDEDYVRRILIEWNPIPGSPDDEYDCLLLTCSLGVRRKDRLWMLHFSR